MSRRRRISDWKTDFSRWSNEFARLIIPRPHIIPYDTKSFIHASRRVFAAGWKRPPEMFSSRFSRCRTTRAQLNRQICQIALKSSCIIPPISRIATKTRAFEALISKVLLQRLSSAVSETSCRNDSEIHLLSTGRFYVRPSRDLPDKK